MSSVRRYCSGTWNVGACTSAGVTVAQPFQILPGGKIRRAEMHGRLFASSDAAFDAMHGHGYGVEYFARPSYWLDLRLPRRVRRHIAENPERRESIILRVLSEHDRAWRMQVGGRYDRPSA